MLSSGREWAEVLFWSALVGTVYVYVGYPVLLSGLRLIMRRAVQQQSCLPSVSLLIAAFNEADAIEEKIRNSLDLDYPADRLQIIIASDGCSDPTDEIVRRFSAEPRVRLFSYPRNRGKLAVLNDTMPHLSSEIVALSDATSLLQPDALRKLVGHFADERVGAVSGAYKVVAQDDAELGGQEDAYWRYETFLKIQEAALDSVLGAHGSLYAVRRELYPFPKVGTINDDFVIPLRILRAGYRVLYEPAAIAYERATEMRGFGRRVRIMMGNVQQLTELPCLVRLSRPLPLLFFVSHKLGRLLVPLAMIALLISNAALLHVPFYRVCFLLQAAFYLLVVVGAFSRLSPRILRLPYYFCMINAAMFVGIYYTLQSRPLAWKQDS